MPTSRWLPDPSQLEEFIRQMPVAVAMFDREMRYLAASHRWCRDYGLDPALIRGRRQYELFPDLPEAWREAHRRGLAGETLATEEDYFEREGQASWVKWELCPWGEREGRPEGILVFCEDITRRKQAEILAQQRERQLRAALEAMPDGLMISDREGRFLEVNEAFVKMHRFASTQDFVANLDDSLSAFDAFLPDSRLASREEWAIPRALRGETTAHQEYTLRRRDTGETWVGSYAAAPIRDEQGSIVGAVLVCQDITAEKQTQQELSELHQAYAGVVDHSPDGIARLDPEGRYLFVNSQICQWAGKRPEEFIGQVVGAVRASDSARLVGMVRATVTSARIQQAEWRLPETNLTLDLRFVPEFSPEGAVRTVLVIATNVSEQREAEALSRDLLNNIPDGIARLDPEGRYLFASKRLAAMSHRCAEDFQGQLVGSITAGDTEPWVAIVRRVASSGLPETQEYRSPPGAASRLALNLRFVPEKDAAGQVRSILMIATDLTSQRRAEALADERETMITALFDAAAQAILAVDAEGRIRLENRGVAELFGYAPGELLGQPHDLLLPAQLRERHAAHRQGFMRQPERRTMGEQRELLGRRKDGSTFPVEVRLSHIYTEAGPMAIAIVSDLSVQQDQQKALRANAQEIRALTASLLGAEEEADRRIARELHDDVTQRLSLLSIEVGRRAAELGPADPLAESLRSYQRRMMEISDRIRRISHQMHPAVLDDLGLPTALEASCEELRSASGATVHFRSSGVPPETGRSVASCLYRVCQECLQNVRKHAAADHVTVLLHGEEGALVLTVIDNGQGFDAAAAPVGVGSRSMRERVRLAGGTFTQESVPGEGTRVTARVPLA